MSIAVLSWRNDNARNMSSKFHSWLDLNLTALKESKSLRRQKVNVCPWIMACVWQIQCFSWPRSITLLSSQASVIHRMLWGQTSEDRWTPGELEDARHQAASSHLSSDDIIHCFLLENFPPNKDIDVWKHFPKSLLIGPSPFKTVWVPTNCWKQTFRTGGTVLLLQKL